MWAETTIARERRRVDHMIDRFDGLKGTTERRQWARRGGRRARGIGRFSGRIDAIHRRECARGVPVAPIRVVVMGGRFEFLIARWNAD